ncbi:YggT family protein [Ramlibacter sp. WS9]|uniref:YggT family protein n=1 Tax=Ramlibacter sp. WS9 TaxID=1882741 RepID=UPI0011433EB3|nr:YggT family protein [Ramlibacter sp. WS9]ROZ63655.1 YggT family protein [Ramlibacter sp. WS9]
MTPLISDILDILAGLLGGALLLRLMMQYHRAPFGNPVGRFVFALTNWLVLPLRRVLPAVGRVDTASLVSAYLVELVQFSVMWLLTGQPTSFAILPMLALFGLLRLAVWWLTGLVIAYAVLSWVQSNSPVVDVLDRLCAPMLAPLRKLIPLVGGVDLSPIAFLLALRIASYALAYLQAVALR